MRKRRAASPAFWQDGAATAGGAIEDAAIIDGDPPRLVCPACGSPQYDRFSTRATITRFQCARCPFTQLYRSIR